MQNNRLAMHFFSANSTMPRYFFHIKRGRMTRRSITRGSNWPISQRPRKKQRGSDERSLRGRCRKELPIRTE